MNMMSQIIVRFWIPTKIMTVKSLLWLTRLDRFWSCKQHTGCKTGIAKTTVNNTLLPNDQFFEMCYQLNEDQEHLFNFMMTSVIYLEFFWTDRYIHWAHEDTTMVGAEQKIFKTCSSRCSKNALSGFFSS